MCVETGDVVKARSWVEERRRKKSWMEDGRTLLQDFLWLCKSLAVVQFESGNQGMGVSF